MGIRISHRSLILVILATAIAARLAAAAWWEMHLPPGERFIFPDSESYWVLAQHVARGEPYAFGDEGRRIFRAAGYPVLLSGVIAIGGEQTPVSAARVLGAVLGTATVALVMLLAKLLFDNTAAIVAGAIAAVYPGAVAMSTVILSEAGFCPLMMLQLVLWTLAVRSEPGARRYGWALAAGIIAGLATLMRPSWLLFTPGALLLPVAFSHQRREHLATGAVMLVGLAVVMLPWWVRNYRVAGRFVPTTLTVGESLYDGLNPQATGASDMQFMAGFIAAQQNDDEAAGAPSVGLFEDRLDHRLRTAALSWAKAHPAEALKLGAVKFARIWNVWPNEAAFRSLPVRLVVASTFLPVMVLGLWGGWRFARRGWPYVLCLLPAVYFTMFHVVFVGSIRYRQPALLPLMVLAGGAAAAWWLRSTLSPAPAEPRASPLPFDPAEDPPAWKPPAANRPAARSSRVS